MNKKNQKNKYLIGIITVLTIILIFMIIFLGDWSKFNQGLSNEMKTSLDSYDDRLTNCSNEFNLIFYTGDFTQGTDKLAECSQIVNEAKTQINSWSRDSDSEDIKAARLDYDSTSRLLEAIFIILDVAETNSSSNEENINKLSTSLNLLNQATNKVYEIERNYADTEYYQRYYLTRAYEIEESKKQMAELKSQIENLLTYYNSL